jgi:hypothetical protein
MASDSKGPKQDPADKLIVCFTTWHMFCGCKCGYCRDLADAMKKRTAYGVLKDMELDHSSPNSTEGE